MSDRYEAAPVINLPHNCEVEETYMAAVTYCFDEVDGTLWVANGEYASQVNFCPFCGKRAVVVIEAQGGYVGPDGTADGPQPPNNLSDKLMQAVTETKCLLGNGPGACHFHTWTHPKCAVAAVLRALPENVVPAVWAHRMPSGNFHRFHDKSSVHMDGCIPLYDLAAIAKLADDVS